MTKHEMPPFNMIIEGNRLVPATAWDQERLDSFRRGTKVKVRFTEEKDRILVKKWFAILGLVVKQCQTPWKNKDEAHEAIKLALGIVNLSKTVGGEYMAYPKSLADLEDPEMQDALDQMTELLSRMTGVDVETLKKETAHIQPEPDEPHDPETGEIIEHEASGTSSPAVPDDAGNGSPQDSATLSAEPPAETPSLRAGGSDISKFQFAEGELQHLIDFAAKGMKEARTGSSEGSKLQFLGSMHLQYRDAMKSSDALTALDKMNEAMEGVMKGERDADRIEAWMTAKFLSCEPADLMREESRG